MYFRVYQPIVLRRVGTVADSIRDVQPRVLGKIGACAYYGGSKMDSLLWDEAP